MPTTITVPPPPPNPANTPLGRYLLHPGATSSDVEHHVLRVLATIGHVLLPIALLLGAMVVAVVVLRVVTALRRPPALSTLVRIAPGPDVEPRGAEAFWSACAAILQRGATTTLLHGRPHVAFEIEHSDGRLSFGVATRDETTAQRVALALEAAWPGTVTTVVRDAAPERRGVVGGELRLAQPEWFSLRTDHPTDPYRQLLAMIGAVDPDHEALVQVLVRPASARRVRRARRAATALRTGQPMSRLVRLVDAFRRTTPRPAVNLSADPFRAGDVRAIAEKAASTCFEGRLRYGVTPSGTSVAERRRCRSEARTIAAAFGLYDGRNHLAHHHVARLSRRLGTRGLRRADLLSLDEVASLAHLPSDLMVPDMVRAGAHAVGAPHGVGSVVALRRSSTGPRSMSDTPRDEWSVGDSRSDRGDSWDIGDRSNRGGRSDRMGRAVKVLGHDERRPERQVGVRVADARQHLHVLGSTGTGKSTLLANLVLQDAKAGRGAVVLDPKGDLVRDILDRLPEEAIGRVVLLDPDEDRALAAPPAMNVLDGTDPNLAVDHLVSIFHRLFHNYWGPRTDDVLRMATLSALALPDATLADVPRLLTDARARRACVRQLHDPYLLGFWAQYDSQSPAQQMGMVGPVMNKLRVVLTRPFVAAVLGASRSSFDLGRDVLDGGLLLARLAKGSLGDECSALLGSFIVARVWQEVTTRARRGESARTDATLYLDECQNFLDLPGSLSDMLAEARGYRLSVVAAHQYLGQLEDDLRDALSSNARNKVFFTCGPEDARVIERHVQPSLSAYDLNHLDAFQVAARVVVDGRELPAFTLRTEPAQRPIPGRRSAVSDASRERFGRPLTERRDEVVRRSLAGRRGSNGANHGATTGDSSRPDGTEGRPDGGILEEQQPDTEPQVSLGRSLGGPFGSPLGTPHLPGSDDADLHDDGSITSAGEDADSWSDL